MSLVTEVPRRVGENHDARIGSRFDIGEIIKKAGKEYRRYKFQLNLNAQDSTLKKEAAQDSNRGVEVYQRLLFLLEVYMINPFFLHLAKKISPGLRGTLEWNSFARVFMV